MFQAEGTSHAKVLRRRRTGVQRCQEGLCSWRRRAQEVMGPVVGLLCQGRTWAFALSEVGTVEGSGAEESYVPTQVITGTLWSPQGNSVEGMRGSWEHRAEVAALTQAIALGAVTMQASRGWVPGVF